MRAESAEIVALKALGFLADSSGALDRFLAETGADILILRDRAAEPDFLAAVMDFLLTDDGLLQAFCESESLEPRTLHLLRRALPGAAPGG